MCLPWHNLLLEAFSIVDLKRSTVFNPGNNWTTAIVGAVVKHAVENPGERSGSASLTVGRLGNLNKILKNITCNT